MNFVGKILTVLICVMSLVFSTMAVMLYATHTNWHDVVMAKGGLKEQLNTLRTAKGEVDAKLKKTQEALREERGLKQNKLTQLDETITALKERRDQLEEQYHAIKVSEEKAVDTMKQTQDNLAKLRAENEQTREDIRLAEQDRDANFAEAVRLAGLLVEEEEKARLLEGEKTVLAADVTRLRQLLRRYEHNPDEDPSDVLPNVSSKVIAAVGDGVVEIAIGADDGLKKGHQLQVFRAGGGQSRYLGKIEVVETSPDRAVCRIIPAYRKGAIRVGDSVTSKL